MPYCQQVDVRRLLPDAVVIEGENPNPNPRDERPESLTTIEIDWYISQADSIINGRLAPVFDIPLRLSNIGGIVKYPDPIPWVSAAITVWLIMTQRLSGGDRADTSAYVEKLHQRAHLMLDQIFNGHIRLDNQNSYTSHRTIKSDLFAIPPGTSKDGASSTSL